MKKIRKHKGLLWLMAAFVLLSFLYMAPVMVKRASEELTDADGIYKEQNLSDLSGMAGSVISNAMTLHGAADRPEACPGNLSAARTMLDEIAAREQQAPRILLVRFLAVAALLILCVRVICRLLIRRYGCHMIKVWQNIYYIHQVDGKKGKRLLNCYIGR